MILRLTILERLLHRLHLLPAPIMDAFADVLFGRALVIAVRRGLFDTLAAAPMTTEQIAAATRLHPRALHLLLESCVVAGYLSRRKGAYRLTPEGGKWLCKDSPDSLVNLIAYFELVHTQWKDLETSLERGAPPRPYYVLFNDRDWQVYVLGMRDLARLLLPHVMNKILPNPEARMLLDLGGSHGLYAAECCRRRPGLQATVMDFAPALAQTSMFARQAGVADRVRLLAGNFLEEPLPPEQDVVLMFNIVHGLSEAENRVLFARVFRALRPGGKVYVLDQMRDGRSGVSALARFIPLMVGLNLLNETGGTVYSVSEVKAWCQGRRVREIRLKVPGVTLMKIS